MQSVFKVGDRVRSKRTGRIGTVVDVGGVGDLAGGAPGAGELVEVEWDGREGPPGPASVEEIYAIRPPPAPRPAPVL